MKTSILGKFKHTDSRSADFAQRQQGTPREGIEKPGGGTRMSKDKRGSPRKIKDWQTVEQSHLQAKMIIGNELMI